MAVQRIRVQGTEVKPADLNRIADNLATAIDRIDQRLPTSIVVTVTFGAANADTLVFHRLGRVPTAYRVVGATAAMSVYDGTKTDDPRNTINLKASAVGTARIEIS